MNNCYGECSDLVVVGPVASRGILLRGVCGQKTMLEGMYQLQCLLPETSRWHSSSGAAGCQWKVVISFS